MNLPELTESQPRVYGSLVEIDSDSSFHPGKIENEKANKDLFDSQPLFAVNAINAIKQVNLQNTSAAQAAREWVPGGPGGAPPPGIQAQPEAIALASLGRAEGFWSNEQEIATAWRRQKARASHGSKKYEALLENAWKKYGQKVLEMAPDELAELIDSEGGFEDESAKHDFAVNSTEFHSSIGVSPYHGVRERLSRRLPEYQMGRDVYMRVKSSASDRPFRFTDDEDGLRQFRAYRMYHNTQIAEAMGGNATDIFYTISDMLGNAFEGPAQAVIPDDIISDEWRADPVKLTRARNAIARIRGINTRFRGRSQQAGLEGEKAFRIAQAAGKFDKIPQSDFVITNPDAAVGQAFAEEQEAIKEILDVDRLGGFGKRSRLSPVLGLVDSMFYGTAGLAGLGLYTTDPDSVVNIAQSGFDGLSKKDRERAMLRRVNEAITWRETMSDWENNGFIFPMGESALSSNPQMLRSYGQVIDPFMATSVFKWARHLKRAGMTKAAVETELLRNTNRLRKLADTTLELPPEVRQIVNNARSGMGLSPEDVAKLSDWDVLDLISRGKGRFAELLPDGTLTTRAISPAEFGNLADRIDSFTQAQALARAKRARGLASLANRNKDNVFSQFGAFVADRFPTELRGLRETTFFKEAARWFKTIRGRAQDLTPIGEQIIEGAPNKSIAFGITKGMKGVAMAAGINYVLTGGESANPLGGPGAYVATIYYLNDMLSVMEFAGDKGKFFAEFIDATSNGRQINGSVAAYKVNEKAAAIKRMQLKLTENLTEVERKGILKEVENARSEIVAWRRFQAGGFEKGMLWLGQNTYNGLTSGAILDVMMEANDRTATGAYPMAGTFSIINTTIGSLYRNKNSGRYRKDQQRSVFAYNLMNMDPVQAQRTLDTYLTWRDKGFGDNWISYVNQAFQNRGANQDVKLVTPAEMQVASTLITSSDLIANVEGDQYQMRLNLIEQYRQSNPRGTAAEAEAYANAKIQEILTRHSVNRDAVEKDKAHRTLESQLGALGGALDNQVLELQVALDVLRTDMSAIGIPQASIDSIGQSMKPEDFVNSAAFEAFLARQGVQWTLPGMFQDPETLKKFTQFRGSLAEYLKLKNSHTRDVIRFGAIEQQVKDARIASAQAADAAVNAGEHRWRPGQTFLHTNFATGASGTATVVGNGVFIVDYIKTENPDYNPADPNSQQTVHSSTILIDYTKFDPKTVYEEWGHRLFMADTFRDARTLLYRDAIGEWGYDADGNYLMKNKGWAWKEQVDPQTGKTKIIFPELRAFARSYADRLPKDMGEAYMEQFDMSVERFNENPMVHQGMMMSVFNELFANAYAQRMLTIDPSMAKIASDPSTAQAGLEGSAMAVYSENGITPLALSKIVYGKMMAGELTITDTASMLKAMAAGESGDLPPGAMGVVTPVVQTYIKALLNAEKDGSVLSAEAQAQLAFLNDLDKKRAAGQITSAQYAKESVAGILKGMFTVSKGLAHWAGVQVPAAGIESTAVMFGKGGVLDSLIIKGANERLLAMGLSPEIYGTGGWETGVIFDEDGNPSQMPGNITKLVDMVRYATRTRVGTPDPLLMGDIDFWNDDGSFSPEKSKGVDVVLWAAYNGKPHWLDPTSNSRLKPKATIIKEQNEAVAAFRRMVVAEQAAGNAKGVNISEGKDGFSITGRFTTDDVKRFREIVKKSPFPEADRRHLMDFVDALSDIHYQQVPAFVINYKSMQFASVNSSKVQRRKGGYDSTRAMIPISIFVKETSFDFTGKKLPDGQKMSTLYVRGADLDAIARRQILGWNGTLLDEKGIPLDKDEVQGLFGTQSNYFSSVLDYLSLIASGGDIGATKRDTKYPHSNTVQMFVDKIMLEPEKFGLAEGSASQETINKIAERMAKIVHETVGAPNIKALREKEAKLLEEAEEAGLDPDELGPVLNDNENGRIRIFDKERSIQGPRWAMRDKNFVITDFRLDRMIGARRTDRTIPWSSNSYFWNQVAYGARSPNAWVSVRKGDKPITGVGLHIHDIVAKSEEEGKKLTDVGVADVWEHGSGYRMILTGAGQYRIYDQGGVFVGEEKAIGRAKDTAVKHGSNKPISTRHPFDQTMTQMGFNPQGIQYVVPKGSFIRRSRYISGDGRLMVSFSNSGSASVYDLTSKSAKIDGPRILAKDIAVDPDGKGGFDLSEIQAALEFASDEMTYSSTISYEVVDDISGRATKVDAKETRTREIFQNAEPEMLEFMPLSIGQSVKGTRVYAKTNPAYYTFKRRLIDYLGNYKKANQVIKEMKAQLGDKVETDPQAVQQWVEKYIKDKQDELDRVAQATRDKERAKLETRTQGSVLNPIAEVFANANAELATSGLPPVTRLSVQAERERLLASVNQFSQRALANTQTPLPNAAQDPNFQTVEGEAANRLLKSINAAAEQSAAARTEIGQVINQLWVNASGHVLALELMPSPPRFGGVDVSTGGLGAISDAMRGMVGLKETTRPPLGMGSGRTGFGYGKTMEPNTERYRWTIYTPTGAMIGHYRTREEAFRAMLEKDEANRKRVLEARRRERSGK